MLRFGAHFTTTDSLLPRLSQKAGIDRRVHAHGLRHTHAFELANEGHPLHVIQAQLGHSSLTTTDKYIRHLAPQEVANVMRSDVMRLPDPDPDFPWGKGPVLQVTPSPPRMTGLKPEKLAGIGMPWSAPGVTTVVHDGTEAIAGRKTRRLLVLIDQRKKAPIDGLFLSLGTFSLNERSSVLVTNADTDGYVIVDAVQLLAK